MWKNYINLKLIFAFYNEKGNENEKEKFSVLYYFFCFLFKKKAQGKSFNWVRVFFHWKYSCNSQYEESEIKMIIMKLLCKHITTRFDGKMREKWNDCYKTLMSSPLCFMCYAFLPSLLLRKMKLLFYALFLWNENAFSLIFACFFT